MLDKLQKLDKGEWIDLWVITKGPIDNRTGDYKETYHHIVGKFLAYSCILGCHMLSWHGADGPDSLGFSDNDHIDWRQP